MNLLVALHDVAPPHLAACQEQRQRLADWGVDRATLLVVPNFHGQHPLSDSPDTVAWLRQRLAAGDEVALHGYHHLQRAPIAGRVDRLRAALFTAGEGECLAQRPEERRHALAAGRDLLERQLPGAGLIKGFVAPAWLEPANFDAELAGSGFRWHETATWVAHRNDGPTGGDASTGPTGSIGWRHHRGPVIGFATRSRLRLAASLAWAHLLTPAVERIAAGGGTPARVALHPADLTSDAVQRTLEMVVRRLLGRLTPATYTDGLGPLTRLSPDRS